MLITGLVCTLALAVAPGCPPLMAAPFLFSDSVVTRGVWLATDNPAWWGILALLLIALRRGISPMVFAFAGFLIFWVVAMRQNHILVVPFMVFAALMRTEETPRFSVPVWRRAAGMMAVSLPAAVMVVWFVAQWRGLVSPAFQRSHQEFSLSSLPMTFTLLGIAGFFYALVILGSVRDRWRSDRAGSIGFLRAAGVVAAVCAEDQLYLLVQRSQDLADCAGDTRLFRAACSYWAACGFRRGGCGGIPACLRETRPVDSRGHAGHFSCGTELSRSRV